LYIVSFYDTAPKADEMVWTQCFFGELVSYLRQTDLFTTQNSIHNKRINNSTACLTLPTITDAIESILADRTDAQYDRLLASSYRPSVRPSVSLSVASPSVCNAAHCGSQDQIVRTAAFDDRSRPNWPKTVFTFTSITVEVVVQRVTLEKAVWQGLAIVTTATTDTVFLRRVRDTTRQSSARSTASYTTIDISVLTSV